MTAILVIGHDEKQAIADLLRKAESNRIGFPAMQAASESKTPLPIMSEQTIRIPASYTVTYTIEEHAPDQWMKHISICANTGPGRAPTGEAAEMILKEFGFSGGIYNCRVSLEDTPGGAAVNLMQPLSGSWERRLN